MNGVIDRANLILEILRAEEAEREAEARKSKIEISCSYASIGFMKEEKKYEIELGDRFKYATIDDVRRYCREAIRPDLIQEVEAKYKRGEFGLRTNSICDVARPINKF